MSELLDDIKNLRNSAKSSRDAAVLDQDPDALGDARFRYEKAIGLLRPLIPARNGAWTDLDKQYATKLYQCLGSLGGTWRDAAELEKKPDEKQVCWRRSIGLYDEGYGIESGIDGRYPDFRFIDSYNLIQRLVVRLLREPRCLDDQSLELGRGINVPSELDRAERVVTEQLAGPRKDDAWAMADVALLRILRGEPRGNAWDEFAGSNRSSEAYESNYRAFAALVKSCDQSGVSPLWLSGAKETVGWLAERLKTLYAIDV